MHAALPSARRTPLGFSLIELLITVTMVAILAAVAMPSVMGAIRKGRRADAFAAITAVQQAQERWRSNNAAYASNMSSLGVATTSNGGHYDLAVSTAPENASTAYVVTATARSSSGQVADACSTLSVKSDGGTLTYAGCQGCTTLTYAATHTCWSR